MKYYLKQSIFLVVYNLFMSMTAFAIIAIPEHLMWLQLILFALNIGLYLLIMSMTMFKEGELALKTRNANDLEREQLIRTGTSLPLKLNEEYKPWKGFLMGALVGAPMVICLIIHGILIAINPTFNGAGVASSFIYLAYHAPVSVLLGKISHWGQYFIMLYAIPIFATTSGVAYMLGGRKIQRQLDKISQKHHEIYGE